MSNYVEFDKADEDGRGKQGYRDVVFICLSLHYLLKHGIGFFIPSEELLNLKVSGNLAKIRVLPVKSFSIILCFDHRIWRWDDVIFVHLISFLITFTFVESQLS